MIPGSYNSSSANSSSSDLSDFSDRSCLTIPSDPSDPSDDPIEFDEFLSEKEMGRYHHIGDGESLNIVYEERNEPIVQNRHQEDVITTYCEDPNGHSPRWSFLEVGLPRHIADDADCSLRLRKIHDVVTLVHGVSLLETAADIKRGSVLIKNVLLLSQQLFELFGKCGSIDIALTDFKFFPTMLSVSSIVKNGFEIKLSNNNSCILKNGQEYMHIFLSSTGWFIDDKRPGFASYEGINLDEFDSNINATTKYREEFDKNDKNHQIDNQTVIKEDELVWVLDSGLVPGHVISTKIGLINIRECPVIAGRFLKEFELIGDFQLGKLLLQNVLYCPTTKLNVISLQTLAQKDYECYFTLESATLTRDGETYLVAPKVGSLWMYNSIHERNGWLRTGCPYESDKMRLFEEKYGDEFTMDEIVELFQSLTHECELAGVPCI